MLICWSDEDQAYLVEVPELPGCMADGKTRQEALSNAERVIQEWIETACELCRDIPPAQGRLMSVNEAADRLGLSAAMVRHYCSAGKIIAQKVGRDWAIRRREVERFAAAPRQSGRPAARYTQSAVSALRVAEE